MSKATVGGKYLIREQIGEGNMGTVYEAEHVATQRRCALKVISAGELVDNAEVVGRFEREARAAGVVSSRYIAQVLDAGVDEERGLPFIAMEYLDGSDLRDLIDQIGPLAPPVALRIAAQACLGLHKAHEANIIHRDIKPHNLFLAAEDAGEVVVKVLDFGVAKVKMDQSSSLAGADLTTPGTLLGSPRYMSPEQAKGGRNLDARTDIWSLGAVLYQTLSGLTPFHEPETLGELIVAVTTESPAPIDSLAPWVSPAIADIVHRCLERDREERFPSAQALFDAIGPLIDGRWTIHRDMLRALTEEEKAPSLGGLEHTQVADSEAEPGTAPPAGLRGAALEGAATQEASSADSSLDATTLAPDDAAPDSEGLAATQPAEVKATLQELTGSQRIEPKSAPTKSAVTQVSAQPARRSQTTALVGLVAVVAIGAAAYFAFRGTGEPSGTTAPGSAPSPGTAAPSTAGGATPSSDAKSEAARKVRVVILPEDAAVEVEGKPVQLRDGILELDGVLGDVYRVRAYQDNAETIADVVISSSGALPPKIEVIPNKIVRIPAARPGASVAPKATTTPAAAPSNLPPKPAKPLPMDRNTDEFE